jgi:hypothetical protein
MPEIRHSSQGTKAATMPVGPPPLTNALVKKALTLLAVILVCNCGAKDDTRAIREFIQNSARHAEAHRVGDLVEATTEDFMALPGRYNRGTTRGILFRVFKYYGRFKIHFPRPSIQIDPSSNRAKATIYFVMVRQDIDIPDLRELTDDPQQWLKTAQQKADLYQLKLNLVKQDSQWMVAQAHLQAFKGTGFQ